MFKKTSLLLAASIIILGLSSTANAAPKTKYGVTVVECDFDYEDEKFCTDSRLKSYATVMKERKPNFNGNQIIYIFETNATGYVNKKPYRLVVIDPAKKTVVPFRYSLSAAADDEGKAVVVNNKGDTIHYDFDLKSNRFCFSGNIDAYRNSYGYQDGPFCFKYDKTEQDLVREY
ncbi:hypothetical protein QL982_13610 [Psychrobacter sp. 5A.1]|uniref:hypothetical protein n=1 Tax=Psychrobacter sp. 5A.1 TaxID=3035207 RepID=UPI0025B3372A|nr:hypothetical protein [Psychrobacter sp. 5A.1]MDN3503772.1 hypothetical protein [Psychrobacter sp. 5A.1]